MVFFVVVYTKFGQLINTAEYEVNRSKETGKYKINLKCYKFNCKNGAIDLCYSI